MCEINVAVCKRSIIVSIDLLIEIVEALCIAVVPLCPKLRRAAEAMMARAGCASQSLTVQY
jgi:hypothetical protein